MDISKPCAVLKAYVGESDKLEHLPLYKAIVKQAKEEGMAGATVFKAVMAYGASTELRTQEILDLSSDLSLVIEIVDSRDKIRAFKQTLAGMYARAGCGGLGAPDDCTFRLVIRKRPRAVRCRWRHGFRPRSARRRSWAIRSERNRL